LSTGYEIAFSPRQAEGLEMAKPDDLNIIEIAPSGFGLHFPKIDAEFYLPSLMQGAFGSKRWITAQLGARGGKVKSKAKAKAARANGRLGGRPKKTKKGEVIWDLKARWLAATAFRRISYHLQHRIHFFLEASRLVWNCPEIGEKGISCS
jgi:hypothetical protein